MTGACSRNTPLLHCGIFTLSEFLFTVATAIRGSQVGLHVTLEVTGAHRPYRLGRFYLFRL